MTIQPEEIELVGQWIVQNGKIRGDAICKRIQWLTSHHLKKITISKLSGAWETLFQDPDDKRYWEQTYSQSEMHGGGPPSLKSLSKKEVEEKYGSEIFTPQTSNKSPSDTPLP
jgi:hypothetical protein